MATITLISTACDSQAPAREGPRTGPELFMEELCTSCHGLGREGSWMGPPLRDLGEHWDRETLADFIRTPTSFTAEDERLAALSRKFRAPMADHPILGRADRLTLADWLLEQGGTP